ncbi:MAG TPA: class I SAM-dependent methyltransferase [Planctomycetota bacterium]
MSDERLDPEAAPEASLQEHLARYRFARERVAGRVLDVACGTGYGAALLGAVGVDLSMDALRAARNETDRLIRADAQRLPFGGIFDAVVSFETVEHVADAERFVAECRRVLRPGGVLVMSTPNRELWSPRSSKPLQPHHTREFSRKEFLALLGPFRDVTLFGQLSLGRAAAAAFAWKELSKRVIRALLPLRRFRGASTRRLKDLAPDPAYAPRPLAADGTAAIFVAVAAR